MRLALKVLIFLASPIWMPVFLVFAVLFLLTYAIVLGLMETWDDISGVVDSFMRPK